MKTRELIKQLNEADPTGELECCIENADIAGVAVQPAYWDGCLQQLMRSEGRGRIIGGKYTSSGNKVVIYPLSISDLLLDDPDTPVEFETEYSERYKNFVEKRRKEVQEIHNNVEQSFFVQYMLQRLDNPSEDFDKDEITEAAETFFKENLSHQDKMPDDILQAKKTNNDGTECYASWYERRRMQWDREIQVDFIDKKLVLRRKIHDT